MEQSKLRSALSWADEVEKEEAEAEAEMACFRVQEKQKPNPFGSARPREVVLQERRLHRQQSPPPLSVFRNEFKENIPAPIAPDVADRKEAISPQFVSIFHHPESAIFDPPLRYPPKNVVAAGLFFSSNSFNIPHQHQNHNRNHTIQADQEQTQLKDGHCESMEAVHNHISCGEPIDLEVHGEQKSACVGHKRKGFQGNWKNKDDDRRPRRPPLVEAAPNRLDQNESNQNKSGFQNQKLCNDTAQWIVKGKKYPTPGGKQVNHNKRAEATHSMKMK